MARKLTERQKEVVREKLPQGLARVLADRKASTDSDALLTDLIDIWGGTRQLAIDVHSEFQKAKPGSMTRQRILEMLQRLILTNTTQGIGNTVRPSDMTDEELEATALAYAKRVTSDAPAPAAP